MKKIYFDKLKVGGAFAIDDTSLLPYLKYREKNNFSLEINNNETFELLLKILNSNHDNIHLEASFIGTGAIKITKLNENKLKKYKKSKPFVKSILPSKEIILSSKFSPGTLKVTC